MMVKKAPNIRCLKPYIKHGQIRYYYINSKGEKEDIQKHLSSELPNILIFDENSGDKKRKDNKIDAFLKDSIRVFGNVYMKKEAIKI